MRSEGGRDGVDRVDHLYRQWPSIVNAQLGFAYSLRSYRINNETPGLTFAISGQNRVTALECVHFAVRREFARQSKRSFAKDRRRDRLPGPSRLAT